MMLVKYIQHYHITSNDNSQLESASLSEAMPGTGIQELNIFPTTNHLRAASRTARSSGMQLQG